MTKKFVKKFVTIEVPDGEECFGCEHHRSTGRCNYFDKGTDRASKLPACLAAPVAQECGHHPDAQMTEYNDDDGPWCGKCHEMPDEVNHL